MGLKPPDWLGAWACAKCHAYVDSHHDSQTQQAFSEGVFRTLLYLEKMGVQPWDQ